MTHPKIPKHLRGKVQRTGYGYISNDNMYRLFRYKWTASYHGGEPQRWMLMKPDGDTEFFENIVEGRERIHELQEIFTIRQEKEKKKAEIKKKGKKVKIEKKKRIKHRITIII